MMLMADGGIRMPTRIKTSRKVAKGRKEHFTGQFTFGPDEGLTMDIESNTELRIALVILARPGVVALENQVPFPWVQQNGVTSTHFFDFRVLMASGARRAVMVKSEYRAKQSKVRCELELIAAQVPTEFAEEVVVMTERDLDPIELFNAELMHEMRRPDFEADAEARKAVSRLVATAQIDALVSAIGLGARGFRAIVRLIRSHELELVDNSRISHDAYIRRSISA